MTSDLPDKRAVLAAVIRSLQSTRKMMADAASEASAGATHPESKAEGSKDMRSTEQSYLARGQAMRVEELDEQIARLRFFGLAGFGADDAIAAGALVELEDEDADETRLYFVLPFGAGIEVDEGGRKLTVVTTASPLGRSLLGRSVGDEVELPGKGGLRELQISRIA